MYRECVTSILSKTNESWIVEVCTNFHHLLFLVQHKMNVNNIFGSFVGVCVLCGCVYAFQIKSVNGVFQSMFN